MLKGDSPGAWAHNTDVEVQFAITQLGLHPGDRVLDLGCGWGRHSIPLASWGLQVTGVDLSHDLLALARWNARRQRVNIDWVEADLALLPFGGPFDAVAQICGNLMTWFHSPAQALEALWDVANLLRPGGRLLLGTTDWQPELPCRAQHYDEWTGGAAIYRQRFHPESRLAETQTVIFGPEHERHEYRRLTWWPSPGDMESLFEQVGLVICGRSNGYSPSPYRPNGDGLVYVLERAH
jgi:SAM-dependent methyltransferase